MKPESPDFWGRVSELLESNRGARAIAMLRRALEETGDASLQDRIQMRLGHIYFDVLEDVVQGTAAYRVVADRFDSPFAAGALSELVTHLVVRDLYTDAVNALRKLLMRFPHRYEAQLSLSALELMIGKLHREPEVRECLPLLEDFTDRMLSSEDALTRELAFMIRAATAAALGDIAAAIAGVDAAAVLAKQERLDAALRAAVVYREYLKTLAGAEDSSAYGD